MSATEMKKIQFELVSPEEKLVSEAVRLAVMPGEAGEFGVGADHVPVVASLKYGVVKLYAQSLDELPRCIFITGGFVDVAGPECVVLAEEAIDVNDLGSIEDLTSKLEHLRADLELAAHEGDRLRMQTKIELTEAKIEAVKNKPVSPY
jgi:F-type H+-transporting ATPase subunit epsilon